jgi:hypothetical protein
VSLRGAATPAQGRSSAPASDESQGGDLPHDVGFLRSTDHYFRTRTSIESHFGLGGPFDGPDLDGVLCQWVPLNRTADANFHANPWAVSIETSDNAPGRPEDIVAWSPKQLATLIRLGNWLADEWGVPRRQCPAWDASGFGWHSMWGSPSHWTNVAGEVCPGRRRINQLRTVVFPAIFEGTEEDFFMALTDSQQQEIVAAARQINQAVGQGQLDYSGTIKTILSTVQQVVNMLGALRGHDRVRQHGPGADVRAAGPAAARHPRRSRDRPRAAARPPTQLRELSGPSPEMPRSAPPPTGWLS